jgi:hypothetical protein
VMVFPGPETRRWIDYGVRPSQDAFVKAKAAAIKALALNGGLGVGRCPSGYKLAIRLKLNYATLGLSDAWHLMMMMRKPNEGILEFRRADSLEPLSLVINPAVDPSILLRPAFDPLRSDARFSDLLYRLDIPQ